MWRWLIPIGLASFAAVWLVFGNHLYAQGPHGAYHPGAVTMSWLGLMVAGIPTILLYRLLIAAGERALPRRPWAGAAAMVLAGALLPPLVHNLWVASASGGRDFVGPVPARVDTIAVEAAFNSRDTSQVGIAQCGDSCLRLLFGGSARRVVVGDPAAEAPLAPRPRWAEGEPVKYAPAPALRLERRSLCPPVVTTGTNWARHGRFVGAPQVGPSSSAAAGPNAEDRALALIAAGQCLVAEPALFADAQLVLGWRSGRAPRGAPQPSATGLYAYSYEFIDRRAGTGWTRLSQRMQLSHIRRWTFPFAILPSRAGWIAATLDTTARDGSEGNTTQPWQALGFTLPPVPETDWHRIRDMLAAAVALPPAAARDARHQLAPQYLALLGTRPADAADRTLLPRLIADQRVAADDLRRLSDLPDARLVGPALLARIQRADTRGDDLRSLVHIAYDLRGGDRAALLAMLQGLSSDPERGRDFETLFEILSASERRLAEAKRAAPGGDGVRPAGDFGFSGGPFRPVAFAFDVTALVGVQFAGLLLAFAIHRGRRRARKRLQETDVPVQATP
ncbi:MAG TPA: hypothetical protein VEX35_07075 [Allosphingosinicella sp.]|nr:hypothetical protein [Allosphingosinicella sp.]